MKSIYTIGFAGKNAQTFFGLLRANKIALLLDVRLNNVSQLAGFTKASDLPFFLREIIGAGYIHYPLLAPPADLLKDFRAGNTDWEDYERRYLASICAPEAVKQVKRDAAGWDQPICLLCSEPTAQQCHRRLAAEYLAKLLRIKRIIHL